MQQYRRAQGIEREYAPYTKWLGTAFAGLTCGASLSPLLHEAVSSPGWPDRERALAAAFEDVADRFNALGLIAPQEPTMRPFYNRPFRVLGSGRFADACLAETSLSDLAMLGAIDQFVDSTDVLSHPAPRARLGRCLWP